MMSEDMFVLDTHTRDEFLIGDPFVPAPGDSVGDAVGDRVSDATEIQSMIGGKTGVEGSESQTMASSASTAGKKKQTKTEPKKKLPNTTSVGKKGRRTGTTKCVCRGCRQTRPYGEMPPNSPNLCWICKRAADNLRKKARAEGDSTVKVLKEILGDPDRTYDIIQQYLIRCFQQGRRTRTLTTVHHLS